MQRILYSLYDSRYNFNPDRATMYTSCDTLEEAIAEKRDGFDDAVIVKEICDVIGDELFVIKSTVINLKPLEKNLAQFEIKFRYKGKQISASCLKEKGPGTDSINITFFINEELVTLHFVDCGTMIPRFIYLHYPNDPKGFANAIVKALNSSPEANS